MLTLMKVDGARVVIYPNDHDPAHVPIVGPGVLARFASNCPDGPIEPVNTERFKRADSNGSAGPRRLDTGLERAFAGRDALGLKRAPSGDLSQVRIVEAGSSLHSATPDGDVSTAGLPAGRSGSDAWMTRRARRVA